MFRWGLTGLAAWCTLNVLVNRIQHQLNAIEDFTQGDE